MNGPLAAFRSHAELVDDVLADHLNDDESAGGHAIELDQLDATTDHHALHAFLHDVSRDDAERIYRGLARVEAAARGEIE